MQGQIINSQTNVTPAVTLENCNTFEKQPLGIILTLPELVIPSTRDDKGNYLKGSAIEVGNVRTFPLMEGLVNLEPNGGDVRTSQEGFGSGSVNGLNPYSEVFTFIKGGLCLYKQLSNLHGRDLRVFFVDENNRGYGTMMEDGSVRGFSVNFGVSYRKNVGTTTPAIKVHVLYSGAYAKELSNITSFDVPDDIVGLREIEIKPLARVDAGTISALLATTCTGINVNDLFAGLIDPTDIEIFDNVSGEWLHPDTVVLNTGANIMFTTAASDSANIRKVRITPTSEIFTTQLTALHMVAKTDDVLFPAP